MVATCHDFPSQEAYEMPEGASMSGMEEEKAEAEKAVEESAAQNQATIW